MTTRYLSIIVFCLFYYSCNANSEESDPPSQYITINVWNANDAEFQEISELFGEYGGDVSIGIAYIFSYLRRPSETIIEKLHQYLELSVKYDMPIVVQFAGINWWDARPDLWNWWDPDLPGYDPDNKYNVEWTDWNPDSAVKIGWRNWGRQLRVLPMPNLSSPDYKEACQHELMKLIPIVMEWYQKLPPNKKHLFIGIKLGHESSIGVNNWYYPGGNELLNEPEENDPVYKKDNDQLPGRGMQTIGYAAVSTAGIANSGPLKEEYLTEIIRRNLEDQCRLAMKFDVPRKFIFTHAGGWSENETLYSAAVNEFSCPGWSFYKYAADISGDKTAMEALSLSDAPYWGAVEYLLLGNKTEQDWCDALNNALGIEKFRYLCIYNWHGIKDNANVLNALVKVLQESNK